MGKIILVKPPISMQDLYGELSEAGSLEPPLGLPYLAACLRENGIEVEIIDCMAKHFSLEDVATEIFERNPDYVGITAVTIDIHSAAELAKRLKELNPHLITIIGGVHVTALPNETMERFKQFDIAVINEGEITIAELINALDRKQDISHVNGIIFRRNGELLATALRSFIPDLDILPMPAWDLLPFLPRYYRSPAYSLDRSPSSSLITTRGCGMVCTFCFQGAFGKVVRMHSADYVFRMIKHLYYIYKIRNIRMLDDNFLLDRKRVMDICQMLIKEKLDLTFSCLSRVDTITAEILKLLKRAGCWQLIYGIESGSQKILDTVNKKITLAQIERALKLTKDAGLKSLGYFMIGFPLETEETIRETIDFALRLPLDDFKMNILTPFPGSELYRTAQQYGSFNRDWRKMNMYVEPCFVPAGLTKEKIIALRKKSFRKFYLRPKIILGYLSRIKNPSHLFKLYLGVKSLLKLWLKKGHKIEIKQIKMAYGSILSEVSSFRLSTADSICREIKNNFITRIGMKLIGIPHIGLRMRAATILKFLNPTKNDIVLDAGCGMGLYLLTLAKKIHYGYGVDTDTLKIEEAIRLTRELSINNLVFKQADAINLDFNDNFFDKIICSEVLEHVEQNRKLIKELFRMLKAAGTLIVSTTSLSKINQEHKEKFSHERIGYSLEQLKALFIGSGFSIEEALPYGLFFGQISWRINRRFLLNPFITTLCFYPLMLIASLDKFIPRNLRNDCIGYIIKLKKYIMQTGDTIKYQSKNPVKRFFIGQFQKEVLTLIRSMQAKRVLDVGCGEGYLLSFLDGHIKNWHLEGFDINEELLAKAKQKVPSVSLSVRDIYNSGYPDEAFDLVLSTEVLEHLKYPEKALSEIRRLTKRWAILSVPNEPLFSISSLLAGKNIFTFGRHEGHCNRWSSKGFIDLIKKYFTVSFVVKPFPWVIVLCEKDSR